MSINWNNLRSWNGSQESAFEELCCQLASLESVPAGAEFFRKGPPDAGVECFWRLPSNDEWAWQAKYFRSAPNSSQWRQIDDSVKTALKKHPRLSKYTVCLPLDRSDARTKNQKTFLMKWSDYVVEWQRLASKRRMSVTFEYWGQSELGSRLSNDTQQGRHWFWFNEDRFSNAWFLSRVDEAVANAGDRYSPALNIDLPIRDKFDALGRTSNFTLKLQGFYSNFRIKLKALRPLTQQSSLQEKYDQIFHLASELLVTIGPWVETTKIYSEWSLKRSIPWSDIGRLAQETRDASRACVSEIYAVREKLKENRDKQQQGIGGDSDWELNKLTQLQQFASAMSAYARSAESILSNLPALLLVGDAGQGKTHLLCEIAKDDTLKSRPRILFHGEQFRDHEPWSQMITLLGLNCSREQFIGALEAAGQANNCRVLIIIDALNEGEGNRLWSKCLPGILTTLMRSQWLGICVSIRTPYVNHIIPKSLDDTRLIRVNHAGFGDCTSDAIEKFFSYFKIEPSAPLLLPEFENPLFLKMFCQSLNNQGLTQIPPGLEGITAIFDFFLDSINSKLSRQELLDYDPRLRAVSKAVENLADEMANRLTDRLPIDEAREAVNNILPASGNQKSLFRHLETESVLSVVPDPWEHTNGKWNEYVRFTYQRFADHLITRRLLSRYFDENSPKKSFSPRGKLGKLVKDEQACWMNRGILEALAIQIPEIAKKELPDLAVHVAGLRPMREAFVESIVWRHPSSFTEATHRYIQKEVLRYHGTFEDFWNAMIAVGTRVKHPLNAIRLHEILSRNDLANRDAWWSIFLHQEWGKERAVNRIVNWALAENDKSAVNDEVIRLTGILLAWFFTTSDRFLRDGATKAMVRIFESRLQVLRQVIQMFVNTNDPYVTERLYAVAYGCAMRTTHYDALADLAHDVYGWVFEAGRPPPHILLRDYARGVIEMALYRGAHLNIDISKIRPPYLSDWPSFRVPTAEQLRPMGETREGMRDEEWSLVSIYHSLMGDVLGDFSHYVVGSLDQWSSERIDEPHKPTHREIHDEFVKSLTHSQRIAWESYLGACQNPNISTFFGTTAKNKSLPEKTAWSERNRLRIAAETNFLRTLGTNSTKFKIFKNSVRNYVLNPAKYYRENRLDGLLARRWMLQRIVNMGWTAERFGKFDRNINAYGNSGRGANKPERIGKKYQWIVFHELLARLSDNLKMRIDHWSSRNPEYHGPWDIGPRRDIDPSNLLVKTRRENWGPHTNTWWFPAAYSFWDEERDETDWLKNSQHLPNPMFIIEVTDPTNASHWLTLAGLITGNSPLRLAKIATAKSVGICGTC
jgi:hypothetical protein